MTNDSFYKTIVTWRSGGTGWFYTKAKDAFEAEVIINFVLQRDYSWQGTKLNTIISELPDFAEVYCLDGQQIKSYEKQEK